MLHISTIPKHAKSPERAVFAQSLLSSSTFTSSSCLCASVRVSNVHEKQVFFKFQSEQNLSTSFKVSPQTGTMKPKSSIVIAVAYCGEDTKNSSFDLTNIKFQIRSWISQETKFKKQFSLDFKEVERLSTPSTSSTQNEVEKASILELRRRSKNTKCASNQNTLDDKSINTSKKNQSEFAQNSSSVDRLQQNTSTVVTKCTTIFLQLFLFACVLYLYIYSFPERTGSWLDVVEFKTPILPAFLLGIFAEKIRRRCF
jgi:hypothetical protein